MSKVWQGLKRFLTSKWQGLKGFLTCKWQGLQRFWFHWKPLISTLLFLLVFFSFLYAYQADSANREFNSPQVWSYTMTLTQSVLRVKFPTFVAHDKPAALILQVTRCNPIIPADSPFTHTITLDFEPDVLSIVDEKGTEILGQWQISSAELPWTKQLYLKSESLEKNSVISLLHINGEPARPNIVINVKGRKDVFWTQFWDLMLGPNGKVIALLGSAISVLVGYVKSLQEREKQLKDIEEELRQWEKTLQSNPSEGARQYQELRKKKGLWQDQDIQRQITQIWEQQDPCLKRIVAVLEQEKATATPWQANDEKILYEGLDHLDDRWRQKIREKLKDYGHPLPELYYRLIRRGGHARFGEHFETNSRVEERLALLTGRGEDDGVQYFVEPERWSLFSDPAPLWICGPSGYGRTAIAARLVRDAANQKVSDFYIYWPLTLTQTYRPLEMLAHSTAQALLTYYVFYRSKFLKLKTADQFNLVQLWQRVFGDVESALLMNGLVPYDEGASMLEKVRSFSSGTLASGTQTHIIQGLARLCPPAYNRLTLLVDVQGSDNSTLALSMLLEPLTEAWKAGLNIRVFLAGNKPSLSLPAPWKWVIWSYTPKDLTCILNEYLGSERLETWFDGPSFIVNGMTERVVALAQTPRELINLLKALSEQRPLTIETIEHLLGPVETWRADGR